MPLGAVLAVTALTVLLPPAISAIHAGAPMPTCRSPAMPPAWPPLAWASLVILGASLLAPLLRTWLGSSDRRLVPAWCLAHVVALAFIAAWWWQVPMRVDPEGASIAADWLAALAPRGTGFPAIIAVAPVLVVALFGWRRTWWWVLLGIVTPVVAGITGWLPIIAGAAIAAVAGYGVTVGMGSDPDR